MDSSVVIWTPQLLQNGSPGGLINPQILHGDGRCGGTGPEEAAGGEGKLLLASSSVGSVASFGIGGGVLATGASWTPQFAQNCSPGRFTYPHAEQLPGFGSTGGNSSGGKLEACQGLAIGANPPPTNETPDAGEAKGRPQFSQKTAPS